MPMATAAFNLEVMGVGSKLDSDGLEVDFLSGLKSEYKVGRCNLNALSFALGFYAWLPLLQLTLGEPLSTCDEPLPTST